MNPKAWTTPVAFKAASGAVLSVCTAEDALKCLMNDWPAGEKLKAKTAVRLCLDAIAGECPADDARRAFMEACHEAALAARKP